MAGIIPARKWGRDIKGTTWKVQFSKIDEMTVHYVGVDKISWTKEQVPANIKKIEVHQQSLPGDQACCCIAYNFLIDKWGRIWEGRGWKFMNAANGVSPDGKCSNPTSISVCVLVGSADNEPTPEITQALQDLYQIICRKVKRKSLFVRGHKDHIATSCPGPKLYKLVKSGKIQGV